MSIINHIQYLKELLVNNTYTNNLTDSQNFYLENKTLNFKNNVNIKNEYIYYYNFIQIIYNSPFIYCILFTFICDSCLKILFGKNARWFQLHSLINAVVTKNIMYDVVKIYLNPKNGFKLLENHINSYYILTLHVYHLLTFKNLTYIDYFHHILFVGLGVLPVIFYINSNQIYLGYIACNGIPGIIEYGTLALYKNNKITLYKQKCICSMLYIYLRLPLCIMGIVYNYLGYMYNYYSDNVYLTFYINTLLYFNGTFFTHLTLQSFYRVKYLTSNEKNKEKYNLEKIIKQD